MGDRNDQSLRASDDAAESANSESIQSMTSLSLLERLTLSRDTTGAWSDFVSRYRPRIEQWCRRWGLQEADAADVTQEVLLQLSRQMKTFQYREGGRFRAWLKVVAWRAFADLLDAKSRDPARLGLSSGHQDLQCEKAKEEFMSVIDEESERQMLEVAMQIVADRVKPHTFEAFRLMTFEGLSGQEVAERLNIRVGSVYVARARVEHLLTEQVAILESGEQQNGVEKIE